MNEEQAVRTASASLLGELGEALRQASVQMRTEDATARRAADERTTSRFNQIDLRLEEISLLLSAPTSNKRMRQRVAGLSHGPISAVMVVVSVVLLALAAAFGGKLVGDHAYASGRAVGYAQAAVFDRDHPADWHAYVRRTASVQARRN